MQTQPGVPVTDLSHGAKEALINANTQTGRLPQGTPDMVALELRDAGLVGQGLGLTMPGRIARHRLMDARLEEL